MLLLIMIATIITAIWIDDKDIEIFLTDEEIRRLGNEPLKGEIFEYRDIRNIYPLEIVLDKEFDTSGSKSQNRIHTKISPEGNYILFIAANNASDYYKELVERRWTGTRDGNLIKIDIMSERFAERNEDFHGHYKLAKSLYEHKELTIKKLNERENRKIKIS